MNAAYRRREGQIAEVLVRYEMGHLLGVFGLESLASRERRLWPLHPLGLRACAWRSKP